MQPAFNRRNIAGYVEIMCAVANRTISQWRKDQTIELAAELQQMSSDTIANTLFPDPSTRPLVEELQLSLHVVLQGLILRTITPRALWEYLALHD